MADIIWRGTTFEQMRYGYRSAYGVGPIDFAQVTKVPLPGRSICRGDIWTGEDNWHGFGDTPQEALDTAVANAIADLHGKLDPLEAFNREHVIGGDL